MASSSNNQEINNFELMDSLYSAAADGDIDKFRQHAAVPLDQILTPNGNTILHIHITVQPKYRIFITFVKEMLKMCPDLLWKANKKGETLLHMAARHGHADVAKFLLLECKKAYQNHDDHDQELGITAVRRMLQMASHEAKDTALHEAVRCNHLDVVRILTLADPSLPYDANAACETPLYMAAERGYAEVLKKILSNCISPADHGPHDRTALLVAVIRNDEEMVTSLLAEERIHKSKQDQQGWTPLHFAAHFGYIVILKKLLMVDKSAAYKADIEGKTALHVAASLGRVNVMQELMFTCPSCCEMVDKRGRNVLHFVFEKGNRKAIKLVLENPWLGNLINEKDENGNTPLLLATFMGYYTMRHPKVDLQVFNHNNHNAADIILVNKHTYDMFTDFLLWHLETDNVNPGLRKMVSENNTIDEGKYGGNTDKSKSTEDGGEEDEEGNQMSSKSNNEKGKNVSIDNLMEKTRQNELVAATLIATVTFAAGFTVPGGFVADKGPDQGAAILTRNIAFRAFVILNTMSMFLSSLAVFNHLAESSATHVPDTRELFKQMRLRQLLISYAMMAMIGAFLSGTCAVLHSDRNLAISACAVPVAMFAYLRLVTVSDSISF
ncbi:hypothetical protein Ddye_023341 [Dipteronia dyeriana]|uniref:PGG domain-containing protein n=1 Tax=Dipteronia dyeriana TaxID=168575 RepID=A0AAD9TTD4_9ROSI|nr:hypothetical protein Ddye_023341 [Dipteronia dyeriana]